MSRAPQVREREAESRNGPAPVRSPPARAPSEHEEAQDRLGAQGAFEAEQADATQAEDPWQELAVLLSQMLSTAGPAPAGSGARSVLPQSPAPPERPEAAAARPAPTEPEAAPVVEPATPEPVTLPPSSDNAQLLAPSAGPAQTEELEVPEVETPETGDMDAATEGTEEPGAAPAPPPAATPASGGGPPARTGGAAGAGPSSQAIVRQWQGGVRAAGAAAPMPSIAVNPGERVLVRRTLRAVETRNEAAREAAPADALANVPEAPEVDDPPPPPPSNPVPEHTKRVLDLSDKRLEDQSPPPLVRTVQRDVEDGVTVGGNLTRLRQRPVSAAMFHTLTTPGARELAQIPAEEVGPDGRINRDARDARLALEMLTSTGEPAPRQGRGEPVIAPDTGPAAMRPLPEHLQAPVGQVVARLLAQVDDATSSVLTNLRIMAYPNGVLNEKFPEIGDSLSESLKPALESDLRDIATAANVSTEQLDDMIGERRNALAITGAEAEAEAAAEGQAAVEGTAEEGQKTMDAIDGASQAAEEETLRRQEAAGGASDPAVINRRRDRTVQWIRNHVTTQITNYQNAGDRRLRDLGTAKTQQTDAYRALVQREQYQVLTPQPPQREARDPNDSDRERRLADITVAIRNWGDERVGTVSEGFRKKERYARDTTRTNRSAIEGAGDVGIEAARQWAEDKILDGQSWWDRFIARLQRWLSEADDLNEQWRVRRTQENRDAIAIDLQVVQAAQARLAQGVTQQQILEDQNLSQAERAILQQFFSQEEGTHPLDFAAMRLRTQLARSHLANAQPIFERELNAMPVAHGDYVTPEKLNDVARAQISGFDGAKIAQDVHAAMDQMGTDEDLIYRSLRGLTALTGSIVRKYYTAIFGGDLDNDLQWELSGDEEERALAQLEGEGARADAIALHDAISGMGTDEAAIMQLLRNKTPAEVEAIRAAYLAAYGESLDDALRGDLAEGNEIDQANALLNGDTATADAIALDEAMRGGFLGLGTSEEEIEQVLTRVRSEVLARARAENWTSEQMEAEVRRRLAALEQRFGDRYSAVAQYNAPGLGGGTVLSRAFSSELSGAEHDLAEALADNDLTRADAARIEIERTSFYASDEAINGVLRSQYERALQARRLDEGPARDMRIRREVRIMREQGLSEEAISRRRMAMEREAERAMQDGAQADARLSMSELEQVYSDNYTWPLSFAVEWNTSGTERSRARSLLQQGGRLTPLQEVEYATQGAGTDEDALRRTLSTMTHDEIVALRREWEERHPGRRFDDMLRGELSGRDESDIMDMVEHGAPESALEQIAQEQRRVEREMDDLTGVLGGVAAGNEAAWMQHQVGRLEELREPLNRTDWPDTPEGMRQRQALQEEVGFRVQRVQDAVADHRRRLDSFTDAATQVIGIVVGVTVAIVLGAISGGTLGAAWIALWASLAATASTMATKALVLGGAYGEEAVLTDLAVGAVDAVTAVATAGMGSRLIGPMQKLVQRTRIGDVASWIGRSGLAQRVARAPGAGTVGQFAAKALPSRAAMARGTATFLAEGVEDAVSSVPASFVQIALTDQTWEGDPLMNFLQGGGLAILQSVAMGRMMAGGMHLGGRAFTAGRGRWRMRTEVGRLMEANRIIQDGYGRFIQDNPGASLGDFMAHPQGQRVRAEIDRRGLMPTLEGVTRAAEGDPQARAGREAGDPGARPDPRAEPEARAEELTGALPESVREGTFVTPDPELAGRTVRVAPLRIGNRIVGVDVRVGPDATPMDVALHAATVHAMQRYRGVLGNVRRALEDAAAVITRSGLRVGSRGWEARLEMAKLPAIIAQRMDGLSGGALTPEVQARIMGDAAALERQLQEHQAIMADPDLRGEPGRGYVAAKDEPTSPGRPRRGGDGEAPDIDPDQLEALRRAAIESVGSGDRRALDSMLDTMTQETGLTRAQLAEALNAPLPRELQPVARPDKALFEERISRFLEMARQLNIEGAELTQRIHDEMVEWLRTPPTTKGGKKTRQAIEKLQRRNDELERRMMEHRQQIEGLLAAAYRNAEEQGLESIFDPAYVSNLARAMDAADAVRADVEADVPTGRRRGRRRDRGPKQRKSKRRREVPQEPVMGRRPATRELVHHVRGQERTPDNESFEGFVLKNLLDENILAVAEIRARLDEVQPDRVLGVDRGGSFLVDVVDPRQPSRTVPKEGDSRWPNLLRAIKEGIANGERSFVIIDVYMGGGAIGEFRNKIFDTVLKNADQNLRNQLRFGTIWIREEAGFERNNLTPNMQRLVFAIETGREAEVLPSLREAAQHGDEALRQAIQAHADQMPRVQDGTVRFSDEEIADLRRSLTDERRIGPLSDEGLEARHPVRSRNLTVGENLFETIFPVKMAVGDDMDMVLEPGTSTVPIVVVDAETGQFHILPIGITDPETNMRLESQREIMIALLRGHFDGRL